MHNTQDHLQAPTYDIPKWSSKLYCSRWPSNYAVFQMTYSVLHFPAWRAARLMAKRAKECGGVRFGAPSCLSQLHENVYTSKRALILEYDHVLHNASGIHREIKASKTASFTRPRLAYDNRVVSLKMSGGGWTDSPALTQFHGPLLVMQYNASSHAAYGSSCRTCADISN